LNQLPLITIITVCYNSEETIRQTIESVLNQTYSEIEYLIIDGLSTDGTVEIIKEYEPKFKGRMKWISEKDNGIYDAMNKGICMATGEWINFMNSGDWFYTNAVIHQLFSTDNSKFDLVYGDHEVRYNEKYNGFCRLQKSGKIKDLYKGMIFSHQSLFAKLSVLKEIGFNAKRIKIAQDYYFIANSYGLNKKILKTDIVIASILAGGLSDTGYNRISGLFENMLISHKIWGKKVLLYYTFKIIIESVLGIAQALTPVRIQPFLIELLK